MTYIVLQRKGMGTPLSCDCTVSSFLIYLIYDKILRESSAMLVSRGKLKTQSSYSKSYMDKLY